MKNILLVFGVTIVVTAAWYFVSPLFNTIEVDDAAPVAVTTTPMPSGAERLAPEEKIAMDQAVAEANAEVATPMAEPMPTIEPVESVVVPVMGTVGHPAEGTVRVIITADGPVIRYENFETINGPQLHLYLAKDLEANEYLDLGPIRGTSGNINYQVPAGVDLSEYRYVMYWCVPFGVLFNYAEINLDD